MNTFRTYMSRRREEGFSLVEMSIVLVIIGLIIAAVTVGKRTMQNAEYYRAYQKVWSPASPPGSRPWPGTTG